ncbi:OLC1v1001202C1 [Oldenlandia corymbosa var. corymbosa]|uniref:OLC1v1001202C1 n=1 Tax=Oldenlandia corymbosa var. corymbosa TaxID=529605 RepID=A0AAV1D520_OLDCO|nr:OLC1v1001202C1 [Oldenlandia corymbosa var. corymbosa]
MASVAKPSFLSPPLSLIKNAASSARRVHSLSFSPVFTPKKLKVSSSISSDEPQPDPAEADPAKLAFAKAKEYRESIKSKPTTEISANPVGQSAGIDQNNEEFEVSKPEAIRSEGNDDGEEKVPVAVKLAFEKSMDYKKRKGEVDDVEANRELERRSGVKKDFDKKDQLKVSNIDFLGLQFSEKKDRGLPAGLVPVIDSYPEGDLPEVEILVGDASKFVDGAASSSSVEEESTDVYKPKVSTWGVFPRPSNISKTYGGGRVIRPGEVLETAEDRAAKEARTRQLLSAYKSKIGLNIRPELKSECQKTQLHGLAALQWTICQDSLNRPNEARSMYEKLQSHPNPQVSKKARQFLYGFQAMQMMKVNSSTVPPKNTGYQNYFDAFVRGNSNYAITEAEVDEGPLEQALPYVIILLAPIISVILIVVLN